MALRGKPDLISLATLTARFLAVAGALVAAAATAGAPIFAVAQAPAPPVGYTVLSAEGRRALPVRTIAGQDMFALDDLARLFDLTVREDVAAGGLTVATRSQTIVLSAGQPLASVGGRLISLPAAPARDGRAWYVPVDFVSRALAPASTTRIDLRKATHLIVLGDLRVPLVAGRIDAPGTLARLTLDVSPATPHAVTQEANRLVIRFEADAVDATVAASPAPDFIQSVRTGDTAATLIVELGPRGASFRTADAPGDRGNGRVVVEVMAQSADPALPPTAPPPPAAPELPPSSTWHPPGGCGRSWSTPDMVAVKTARAALAGRSRRTSP